MSRIKPRLNPREILGSHTVIKSEQRISLRPKGDEAPKTIIKNENLAKMFYCLIITFIKIFLVWII